MGEKVTKVGYKHQKIVRFTKLTLALLAIHFASMAQVTSRDSNAVIPMLQFSYAYQIPYGDLQDRFSDHSALSFDFVVKTPSRFYFGVGTDFNFGGGVKETTMFDSISTSEGQIIDANGRFADIRIFQRGFRVYGSIGYHLGGPGPNVNSGFFVMGKMGFWQHRIFIDNIGGLAPQLGPDYRPYYDRMTNGFYVSETFGYLYLANDGLFNAFAGIEFSQGFLKGRRDWQMDLRAPYNESQTDITLGFRIGFTIAIYPKNDRNAEYYYY